MAKKAETDPKKARVATFRAMHDVAQSEGNTVFFLRYSRFANKEQGMVLKPQDVFILLKLLTKGDPGWSYSSLAHELFMSPSEVHSALKRAVVAHLFDEQIRKPIKKALEEFLIYGVKYVYPPLHGGLTRGIPTSHAGPPLRYLVAPSTEPPPVWPYPEGEVRGYEFSPLYKSVPKAALEDHKLYELLVLVDAIRGGRARERELAVRELKERLQSP